MYSGSAVLPEAMLPDLLQLGDDLKVIGLHLPPAPALFVPALTHDVVKEVVHPSHFLDNNTEVMVGEEGILETGTNSWVCETCHAILSSKNILRRHKKKHTHLKLTCEECGKAFSRKDALKVHMEEQHGSRDIES